ncbi:MAG TPA: aminotransferase class V-fold PLP-dependent enzyme [Gaiellaceae bacterium]|nr:aminotransferase class V-fold PLP-dependent enzyme [Gaiellaceae bacterium]
MREHFLLDPDVVFLNHGSFGACPRPVFETYQAFQRELERQPVEFLAKERRYPELLDHARERLADYLGADEANVVFMTNATSGLNSVMRSLDFRPGDEILCGDMEYGGMQIMLAFLAERTGVTIVSRPFAELEPGPRTRVVFCSHIEWISGRVNDLAPVIEAAHDAGAIVVVDGAHAPGQIPLALDDLGADVYSGNCHKWMCAPKGAAFLYVRPNVQPDVVPPIVSWDWPQETFAERHRWQGTRDPAAFLAVPAAIDFQAEHDWPSVRERCHALLASLELPFEPLTDAFVQMRGFALPPGTDGDALKNTLYDRHRVEVPIVETPNGLTMRVSVQAYNDKSDLDALVVAVNESI